MDSSLPSLVLLFSLCLAERERNFNNNKVLTARVNCATEQEMQRFKSGDVRINKQQDMLQQSQSWKLRLCLL